MAPFYWSPGSKAGDSKLRYFTGGFLYIQNMVDYGLITHENSAERPLGVYMQLFPYQCYTPDSFLDAISGMLPILMSLSWVFTVAITVKNIVWEKESRQKEIMRIMGLSGTQLKQFLNF